MATFFFHSTEGDVLVSDLEGVECSSLGAVQKTATESAGALIAEAVKKGQKDYRGHIEVIDASGVTVLTLTSVCTITIGTTSPFTNEN